MKRYKLYWIKTNSMDQPTNETKLTPPNYVFFIKTKIKEHKRIENEEI